MTYSKHAKGCALVKNGDIMWWKAELQWQHRIMKIKVHPRKGHNEPYKDVTTSTSTDGKTWVLCEKIRDQLVGASTWVTAKCSAGATGRFIRVENMGNICEVQAFGYSISKL